MGWNHAVTSKSIFQDFCFLGAGEGRPQETHKLMNCVLETCFSLLRPCYCGRMMRISHLGSSKRRVSHLYIGAQKWLLCLRQGIRFGFFTGKTNGRADKAPKRALCWRTLWDSQVLWAGCYEGYFMCIHADSSPVQKAQGRNQVFLLYEWKKDPAVTWWGLLLDGSGYCWTLPLKGLSWWRLSPLGSNHNSAPNVQHCLASLGLTSSDLSFYLPLVCSFSTSFHGFPGSWDYCWYTERSRLSLVAGR